MLVQETIQAGTNVTIAQFQGVLQHWRRGSSPGEVSHKAEIQRRDSKNGLSQSAFSSTDDKVGAKMSEHTKNGKAAPDQRSLFNMVRVTSGQLVEGLQFQAEKARETLSKTAIMRG